MKNVPARFQYAVTDFVWETNLEFDSIDSFKVVNGKIFLEFSTKEGHKGSASFYALTSPNHPQKTVYSWHNVCFDCGGPKAAPRVFAGVEIKKKYCDCCFPNTNTLSLKVLNSEKIKIQENIKNLVVTEDKPLLPPIIWQATWKKDEKWLHFRLLH